MTDKAKQTGPGKGHFSFRRFIACFMLFCLLATILFMFLLTPAFKTRAVQGISSPEPELRPTPSTLVPSTSPGIIPTPAASGIAATPEPRAPRPRLYIVIDDVGNNLESLQAFFRFPGALTFAVLPGLPQSRAAARLIHRQQQAVILHQPMEAIGGQATGPGAVISYMDDGVIERQINQNLDELQFAAGLNNHMGSLGTQDGSLLQAVMRVLKTRNLFFLDSRTSPKSQVKLVAQHIGVSIVERDVFLDNDQSRDAILQALQEGVKIAEKRGYAVMIGHAWSAELAQVLIDTYPHLVEQGYDFDSLVNYFLGGKGFIEGSATVQAHGDAGSNE